jgi:hypothetical protein
VLRRSSTTDMIFRAMREAVDVNMARAREKTLKIVEKQGNWRDGFEADSKHCRNINNLTLSKGPFLGCFGWVWPVLWSAFLTQLLNRGISRFRSIDRDPPAVRPRRKRPVRMSHLLCYPHDRFPGLQHHRRVGMAHLVGVAMPIPTTARRWRCSATA